jgi:hypothetical protein
MQGRRTNRANATLESRSAELHKRAKEVQQARASIDLASVPFAWCFVDLCESNIVNLWRQTTVLA